MEWFENEDFWRDFYPFMFSAERFAAAPLEVTQILELAKPQGTTVLDLCCGPGRHSVEFARRGFQVTGVDRSPFLLGHAIDAGKQDNVAVEWVQQDMREFIRPSSFHLALSLFTSFGYFQTQAEEERVLGNIHSSLKPGGVLVLDVKGKEGLAHIWKDSIISECADGSCVIQRPRAYDDFSRLKNEWLLVKDGRCITHNFEHFIYSGRELKDLLLRCGFADVKLHGDLQGSAYELKSPRLVAVARKNA